MNSGTVADGSAGAMDDRVSTAVRRAAMSFWPVVSAVICTWSPWMAWVMAASVSARVAGAPYCCEDRGRVVVGTRAAEVAVVAVDVPEVAMVFDTRLLGLDLLGRGRRE